MENRFFNNVIAIWGEQGRAWLQQLPALVETVAHAWGLTQLQLMPNLSYNYVLAGIRSRDNVPIIVKLGIDGALLREMKALQAYAGHGCVRLLDADVIHKALLLERISPGTELKSFFPDRDDEAVMIAAEVMKQLHLVPIHDLSQFTSLADWFKVFDRIGTDRIPEHHLKVARRISSELLKTQTQTVLLHGDLHHDNILLSAERNWLAIDPKGILGDPAFEAGVFMRNPIKPNILNQANVQDILARRLKLFSTHLNIDLRRLQQWCYVYAVLAACWAVEDNVDPKNDLLMAEYIKAIKVESCCLH